MGTYLKIQIKENVHITPKAANEMWFEMHPIENIDASLPQNFNSKQQKQGPAVHFYTEHDLLKDARYVRDVDKRIDLGFESSMTDQDAMKLFQEIFKGWGDIGSCELKLSGEHYCTHKLKRVKRFISKYRKFLTVDGYKDLLRYIKYDRTDISFLSTNYCGHCLLKAQRYGILLPVVNNMIDATGKNITDLYEELLFGTPEKSGKERQ